MLFSIAGSQGTGKSTLISELKDKYPNDIPKTSRSILSDWNLTLSQVNNDRELTVKFQEEILKRKITDEAPYVSSEQRFCTERTYADLFVYALVAIGKDNEYSDWLDDYFLRCKTAQKTYEKVFYLTGGHFPPVNDGVRGINKHYSKMVDLVMFEYTFKTCGHDVGVILIDYPHLEWRVAEVNRHFK
jgi:predicted ABC-type ATPase